MAAVLIEKFQYQLQQYDLYLRTALTFVDGSETATLENLYYYRKEVNEIHERVHRFHKETGKRVPRADYLRMVECEDRYHQWSKLVKQAIWWHYEKPRFEKEVDKMKLAWRKQGQRTQLNDEMLAGVQELWQQEMWEWWQLMESRREDMMKNKRVWMQFYAGRRDRLSK